MYVCMYVCMYMYVCKVTISTQTCHSLYAKSVDEYVCQAQA